MKIAIIGAGFSGLAVAWHLLQHNQSLDVQIFDSRTIGHGTSGIAAGLLHPFSGAHAKLNWQGFEGFNATCELVEIAASSFGKEVAVKNQGILRLALTESQKSDFILCAKKYSDHCAWLDPLSCQKLAPGTPSVPALWIKEGMAVLSKLYLQGLWQACASRGAKFEQRLVKTLDKLKGFDRIVVAAGAESRLIPEFASLPLKTVKGQVLEIEWPKDLPPLNCALNSHVYLLMAEGNRSCLVGSTYEKDFVDDLPDIDAACREILPKLYQLYPPLEGSPILNCYAGLRAVTPDHRPLMKEISPSVWVLSGMGSKGLLYHSLFAKKLVEGMLG